MPQRTDTLMSLSPCCHWSHLTETDWISHLETINQLVLLIQLCSTCISNASYPYSWASSFLYKLLHSELPFNSIWLYSSSRTRSFWCGAQLRFFFLLSYLKTVLDLENKAAHPPDEAQSCGLVSDIWRFRHMQLCTTLLEYASAHRP